MFKQLLQPGAIDVLQSDASRVAAITENVGGQIQDPGVPARGRHGPVRDGAAPRDVRLCRGQRDTDDGWIEYVDHLNERFVDPVVIRGGYNVAPAASGLGARMRPESVAAYCYPAVHSG